MNWDYFFRLSATAQAVEQMLAERYQTEFGINQFTRNLQFEEYFDQLHENIHEAALKTGIKVQTLKTYVSRKPDRYAYIEPVA
jgi:hypothetical protein